MPCPRPPTRPPPPVAEAGHPGRTLLLSAEDIAARVEALADRIAPRIDDDAVAVCLLTGGLWFAADLMRALATRGRHPLFDALWLSSYADERSSLGRIDVRAGLQRSVDGRTVLLIDDVADSGLSLAEAARIAREAGAATVLSAAFARKPWPTPRAIEPDFVGWEAPDRFLVGYGLDDAGRLRGLPEIAALD
jgi:hypoxanthine phosphoribosyltransferase